MSASDSGLIARIKAALRIEDVVGRYVELRPAGSRLVAPCPFHQETKPSFSVNPDAGFYYCFGCQAAGDVIEFYRAINGLELGEAVEALAREAGLETRRRTPRREEGGVSRTMCLEMHSLAAGFYRQTLNGSAGRAAREYIAGRGLSPETVEHFSLGWAPDGWNALRDYLRARGFGYEAAEKAGLLSRSAKGSHYDRFRERLIFPIMNLTGQTVAFGGRALVDGDGPKYLNSSETPIYTKGEHLYGLYQARRAISHLKSVLLTEGYVDVLSLHQFGFGNSCGVLGTALTPEQVHRLSGLTGRVDLVFDGDNAGRKAALRAAEMVLGQGLHCRVLCLPEGEDVDSILQQAGKERLESLMAGAVDGLDYCLEQVAALPPKEILNWARGFVSRLKQMDWQSYYLPRLAAGLGLSEAELRRELDVSAPVSGRSRLEACKPVQVDRELLAFAVRFPEYREALAGQDLDALLFSGRSREFWKKLRTYDEASILQHLDAGERKFYVSCQMRTDVHLKDAAEQWREFLAYFEKRRDARDRAPLRDRLLAARRRGDFQEELRLLALYDKSLSRDQ